MDLKFDAENQDFEIEDDLIVYQKPVIEDVIRHWQALKGSAYTLEFDQENKLNSIDENYGSFINNLVSQPLTLEWIEEAKKEILDAAIYFRDRISITDINFSLNGNRQVDLRITYIDNDTKLDNQNFVFTITA